MSVTLRPSRIGYALSRVVAWGTIPVYAAGMGSLIWMDSRIGLSITLANLMLSVGFGAFAVVGSLLVLKRPANPVSWIMVAIGLMAGLFPAAETYAAYLMTTRGSPDALAVFGAWANAIYWVPLLVLAFVYLPLLFPDGHLPSPRWLPVAVVSGVAAAGYVLIGAFTETLTGQNIPYHIANPIGIKGMPAVEKNPLYTALVAGVFIGILGAVAAMFVRFRRSRGVERQQLKWFLYAVALTPALMISDRIPLVGDLVIGLVLIGLPAAVGVAVMRYRLFDIDLIIRRTLLYAALTAILLVFYFGGVVLLQRLLDLATAQVGQSSFAIVVSTLAIAALFNPLRRRLQEMIDRRFYRRRYDAEQTLVGFGELLRSEVDLEQINNDFIAVIEKTLQPERVSLWLRTPGQSFPPILVDGQGIRAEQ